MKERRNIKELNLLQVEMISMRTNLLEEMDPEERGFSNVWFQLEKRFQSGFMAMVKGGFGVFPLLPHAGAAALVTLGHTGGSGLTAVAEEQQGDVLLPRQDSGDCSFRECPGNYSAWAFVV